MRVRSISHARVAVLLPHMPPPAGGCRADGGSSVDFLITGGGGVEPGAANTFQGDGGTEASARSRNLRLLDITPLLPPS